MNEEENKDISNQTHSEVKQNKKRKKKRHKKSSSSNIQNQEGKNEEPKTELNQINGEQEKKEEPKNEINEVQETKEEQKTDIIETKENKEIKEELNMDINKPNQNEENKEKSKIELKIEIEQKELTTPESNEPIKENEEKEKNISISKNEEIKQDIIKEETNKETSKKSKGKKKKRKNKGKKEEKIEENKPEENLEENTKIKTDINSNLSEDQKISTVNIKNENNKCCDENENSCIYPEKEIDPKNLISVDEDDGEIDYLKAEQAYELSVLLESHKFIRNVKDFDRNFINLIRRQIIRYERNLYELSLNNNKFFILYELQLTNNSDISIMDIMILDTIKSILLSYPTVHLIIFIPNEKFLNDNKEKNDSSLTQNLARNKLANILIYLNLDSENEKRIHAFSCESLKSKNEIFENQIKEFIKLINIERVKKLFNLESNSEEENDLIYEYPCSLSIAANPSLYTKYIPEITSDFKCLIINSIYNMNRHQLCFSAAKALSFPTPSLIAIKIIPPFTDNNNQENNLILSSDENSIINNKIKEVFYNENGKNINYDIFCQYLAYLEENNEIYEKIINNLEEEKENNISKDYIDKIAELVEDKFKIFKTKNIKDIDVNKILIED